MRTVSAIAAAFLVAAIGLLIVMPALSNGGLLSGYEFFGFVAVGAFCFVAYYAVAKVRDASNAAVLAQSLVVGFGSPFVVLAAPLVYCIAFKSGTSCV